MTFKFFREYNKYILIIGVCVLMFVFLIEGTLMPGRGEPGTQVIGTLKGKDVTMAQKVHANEELRVLESQGFYPGLRNLFGTPDQGALKWMLVIQEAQDMGLNVSATDTDTILKQAKVTDAAALTTTAANLGVSTDLVREAARKMALFLEYDKMTSAREPRLSPSEVDHLLSDFSSQVKVLVTLVSAQKNLPNATEPDDKAIADLYAKYKDSLAGQSKPYGIGFKIPNRAKIEYLSVPMDRVRQTISVNEVEALAYYDSHKEEFAERAPQGQTQPSEPKIRPYDDVASEVRSQLLNEKTQAKSERIIRTAAGLLAADAATLPDQGGYKVLPETFKPTSLSTVARQIEQQFKILPDVVILNDRWLDQNDVRQLPGIGQTYMQNGMSFAMGADYVFSAKEFGAAGDQNLSALRLQVGMPSAPLHGMDGNVYIFRLTGAEPARVPNGIDEVKPQVVAAAKLLSSYQQLIESQGTWLTKVRSIGMGGLVQDLHLKLITPPPFARRTMSRTGVLVPSIDGVGVDAGLIDKVFDLATTLENQGGVDAASPQKRTFTYPVDSKMSLAIVELEALKPLPKQLADLYKTQPSTIMTLQRLITSSTPLHPISLPALAKRVGFVGKHGEEKEEKAPEEEPAGFGGGDDDQG